MKLFLASVLLLSALLTSARAQQDADGKYIVIYTLIQQGDALRNNGQPADALAAYQNAQAQLQRFQKLFPDWDTDIVNYRLNDLAGKIAGLQAQLPAKTSETPASAPVDHSAKANPPADILQSQLQAAQDENARLQAKLKEALSTQPDMVDAGALVQAQDQIRSLMKENDLLKACLSAPVKKPDDAAVSQLRSQLAESAKKLADEHARAEKLVDENAVLQRDLAHAGKVDVASFAALRDENDRLKSQLTALQAAANNANAANGLSAQLADARAQVAALQSTVALATLEKTALENRLQPLSSELADRNANFQASLRKLTAQRDDLLRKLDKAKNSRGKGKNDTAQIAALKNEVATLQARIDVDEAKPVPYSEDELALVKPAAPAVEPVRKSIAQMPVGTAELVASAQQHFSNHEFDQAEADYRKILQHDENNGLALANLAAIELQENKLADAEKHIKAALAQSPDDAFNLATLGFLKFRQEKYDEALDALSRAAKLDPQNPEIQNYLGVTLSHKGLRMQAETALRKAIEIDPNYAPAHNNLAVIYLTQNPPLPQLARWHYEKALAAGEPRNPDLEKMLAGKGAPASAPQ